MTQMKLSKTLLTALAICVIAAACKKEDDSTTTYKSFSGTFEVGELPSFVNPGDEFDFVCEGLSFPEDETDDSIEIVYTFSASDTDKTDTVSTYHLVVPDIVGEFTLTAKASATGYYTKTVTLTTTVVSDKSITGANKKNLAQQHDPRDAKRYHYTTIGVQKWFSDNLAYFETDAEGNYKFGRPYMDASAAEDAFGGFYTWDEAQRACPTGWHLPSLDEWNAIGDQAGDLMCDAYYNGARLWEFWPDVQVTNSKKFFAYPFGYVTVVDSEYTYTGFNDYAFFWADKDGSPACCYIYVAEPKVKVWDNPSPTDFAAQIRCVK